MAQPYGKILPDQVDRLASLSDAQLELLADVRELFRERIALEREYATKLQILTKKAADKKARKIASLVVGNEPTKAVDGNSIKQSTLDRAYTQLVASFADSAQDHSLLADALNAQVADALKAAEKRHDEAKKRQMQYFQKLLSDRDKAYSDRLKSKQKYDEECAEIASYKQKQERSTDDRHAERAAKQYEQQQVDMYNSKNVYLISTAIANSAKTKFYNEDLPALEDQFQELQTQLQTRFAKIVIDAQALHIRHLDTLKTRVNATENSFKELNTAQDQEIFIDHNIRPFSLPPDWSFEPCATHYDTDDMNVEPAPKVYLQNRLGKCRQKLQELDPIITAKRKEVDQLQKLVQAYNEKDGLGSLDEVSDNYLEAAHQLAFYANSERVLLTEIETISTALDGDEGGQHPHTFKSSSFSIPTQCAYCKSSIWGLSKQGKSCKACGISVHSKCELKVPANCSSSSGERGHASSRSISSISHTEHRASNASSLITPTPSSFAQSDAGSLSHEDVYPTARVLFDFVPTSPFELQVTEGTFVRILEEDDGSGWVKVTDDTGGKGLVPASYIEIADSAPPARTSPPSSATEHQNAEYVRAVYDYAPQGPDELSLQEGQVLQLTDGPNGGRNYADGWWEGIGSDGEKGIFPSNYVEIVS